MNAVLIQGNILPKTEGHARLVRQAMDFSIRVQEQRRFMTGAGLVLDAGLLTR